MVMTVAASVVGIAISIPIGLGAARNIAPLPVYMMCRGIVAVRQWFHSKLTGFPR